MQEIKEFSVTVPYRHYDKLETVGYEIKEKFIISSLGENETSSNINLSHSVLIFPTPAKDECIETNSKA
jgi:hypothetical protein